MEPQHSNTLDLMPIDELVPYKNNARTHSPAQIDQIARSIERFGFTNPVLIGDDKGIIAGHGRVVAARQLGIRQVPVRVLSHLSAEERRAYILADNKLALNAGWDQEILAIELADLADFEFDLDLTGFSTTEIDLAFEFVAQDKDQKEDPDDLSPVLPVDPVTQFGDCWDLGSHRLVCGDARSAADFDRLLQGQLADLIFTDPPYNVEIDGNVCGSGAIKHKEFAFASGEMDRATFTGFLTDTLANASNHAKSGAIAYVCMDWRHMREIQDAGEAALGELKNLCVWNKTNGGMGSFYRSKHELVFVFKKPGGKHQNNFGIGAEGRYRTNVWDYPGISSLGAHRSEELAMHPTVKPVALIADAIRDCSRQNEIVLDCFAGSGSTLIAAERTKRKARLIEYDPAYCDVIIERWQKLTGQSAVHSKTGLAFEEAQRTKASKMIERQFNQSNRSALNEREIGNGN